MHAARDGIQDRYLPHQHVAGGDRGHAADTAGDRPGGHARRGDAGVARVRGVRGFHRAAPGAPGRAAVRGRGCCAGAGNWRYGWQRHLSGPA